MAQLPQDYPITTPFGWVVGYPLNQTDPVNHPGQGFHNGIDYGAPMGTPVIVNGVTIGLSNNTGATTGPHLHVGKYVNGVVQDPGVGNGFNFNSAVVYDIGEDDTDGIYVRITGDGALWNYLHLGSTMVTARQILKGETDMGLTPEQVNKISVGMTNLQASTNQNFLNNEGLDLDTVLDNFLSYSESKQLRLDAQAYRAGQTAGATVLKPGNYKVN